MSQKELEKNNKIPVNNDRHFPTILTSKDLFQIPTPVKQKFRDVLQRSHARLVTYDRLFQNLRDRMNGYVEVQENFRKSLDELGKRLDAVTQETLQMQSSINSYQKELCELRSERDLIASERDELLKKLELKKNSKVECLEEAATADKEQLEVAESEVAHDDFQQLDDDTVLNKFRKLIKRKFKGKKKLVKTVLAALNGTRRTTVTAESGATSIKVGTTLVALQLQHKEEVKANVITIEELKTELAHLKDSLTSIDETISKDAVPSIADTSMRLVHEDLSFEELYSIHIKTCEQLYIQKRINKRFYVKLETVLNSLEPIVPVEKNQMIKYEELVEMNKLLQTQCAEDLLERAEQLKFLAEAHTKCRNIKKENRQLKRAKADLKRQVRLMTKEINNFKSLSTSNEDLSNAADRNDNNSAQVSSADETDVSGDVTDKQLIDFDDKVKFESENNELHDEMKEAEDLQQEIVVARTEEKLE